MYNAGDIVVSYFPFADSEGLKVRPAVVLFKERDNIVLAGITSNPSMKGIPLTKKEGVIVDSVIKTNYIYTTSEAFVKRKINELTSTKRKLLFDAMVSHLGQLTLH